MGKIRDTEKAAYLEKRKGCQELAAAALEREAALIRMAAADPGRVSLLRVSLAEEMLNLTSLYLAMNGVSQEMLKMRDDEALNEAREALYKGVLYLEQVVSARVDVPFSDYEDKLREIASLDAAFRYHLLRKLGLTLRLLMNACRDNTKWMWTFVDLEGRLAAVAKNLLDLKALLTNLDPRSPHYRPTAYHLQLVKKLLAQAADRYWEKYELATKAPEDLRRGIAFLGALKRLHGLMEEREEAEMIRRKSDVWTARLEADLKAAALLKQTDKDGG